MRPQATPQKTPKSTSKRKDTSESYNSHKKGPATPSFDLRLTEDMDFTDQIDSTPPQTTPGLSHTPPHFFKAARKGKKAAAQAPSYQKIRDIVLPPNLP
jgi:hypothetical protein